MMEGDEYIQASKGKNVESLSYSSEPSPQTQNNPKKKKSKMVNKRRFSDEQIRSLECIFESESKLEPRKKIQLARDLGLQPRQVAIWFQNRRARWKSKRMEQEYRKLRDEYDNLASKFESLKKEKESLQLELHKLNDLVVNSHDGRRKEGKVEEAKPSFSNGGVDDQIEKSRKGEKSEVLKIDEHLEIPLASIEKWYSEDPSSMLDQSCSGSQWLDFWT